VQGFSFGGPVGSTPVTSDSKRQPTYQRIGPDGKKKPRTQFSACRQCRARRVKCDLRDKQEAWDSLYGCPREDQGGVDTKRPLPKIPPGVQGMQRDELSCSNCSDRKQECM
jgi:hypothetical protein